jgi:hypothetical protein
MARRHADEIRAAAEEEADRVLRNAEREAARRNEERLESHRRERERLLVLKRQIEDCLDAASTALARSREQISLLPDVDQSPLAVESAAPEIASLPADPTERSRRHRMFDRMTVIGFGILGVWAVVMIAALVMVANRPATIDATETVANRQALQAQPTQAQAATPAPAQPAPSKQQPSTTDAAPASSAPGSGLTIAFVATRDCWISITRDDGATSERLLKASEKFVVRANDAVVFKAGNAAALSVLINDQPAGPLGREGQVVTRRITRANYQLFLAS